MGDYSGDSQYDEDEDGTLVVRPLRAKAKRRTRKDGCERGFKCGCGKDYLSYPALYTHVKQKHGGQPPIGTDAPTSNGPRRGRRRRLHIPSGAGGQGANEESFLQPTELGNCDPVIE